MAPRKRKQDAAVGLDPVSEHLEDKTEDQSTQPYLSWAAMQFISAPSSRVYQTLTGSLIFLLTAGLFSTALIQVNTSVEATGEITIAGRQPVVSHQLGVLTHRLLEAGDNADISQPIGLIDLSFDEWQRLRQLQKSALNRLNAKLDSSFRKTEEDFIEKKFHFLDPMFQSIIDRANRILSSNAIPHSERVFLQTALESVSRFLQMHELYVPTSGILLRWDQEEGQIVKQGQLIASVAPLQAQKVIKLKISQLEGSAVEVGQDMKYSFPSRYGRWGGKVKKVETFWSQTSPKGLQLRVIGSLERLPNKGRALLEESPLLLVEGMQAQTSIITGRKSLFEVARDKFLRAK